MTDRGSTLAGRALQAGGWLALWGGFAWCIGLRAWGRWYSPSIAHRLETEALRHGTFALQPLPHGQMADWAWGNGSQHVWGLGVALVRFPFEVVAHAFGAVGFPDRVTLLLAFVATSLLCARAFRRERAFERFVLVLVVAGTPAFVTLCRTRLAVYEESVAYAHLWAVAMACLLLIQADRRRDRDLFAVAVVAGLAPFFRPTLTFDAAVTFALAVAVRFGTRGDRSAASAIVVASALAVGALGLVGFVGERRFGSPFETGQLLNVSYIPTDQAAKLFGYPFRHEPFGSAVAELVSSLALPARWNAPQWYARDIHPWQSPTVRFREFYFTTFRPVDLLVLGTAWLAIAAMAFAGRRRAALRALVAPPVGIAALWSAAVFACQFVFYLRAPSMTSRYAVDFAAPFALGASALVLVALRAAEVLAPPPRRSEARVAVAGLAVLWALSDVATAEIAPSHAPAPLFDAAQIVAALRRPVSEPRPLPDVYRCGDAPEGVGIKFNGSGWATPGGCEVHAATMLFFERAVCVRVRVAPVVGAPALRPEDAATIRAKLGLSEMERRSDVAVDAARELTFCAPVGHRPNPRGIELLYFGWTTSDALSPDVRPFRLLEVAKVAAP